jgi:hypothetical protein
MRGTRQINGSSQWLASPVLATQGRSPRRLKPFAALARKPTMEAEQLNQIENTIADLAARGDELRRYL